MSSKPIVIVIGTRPEGIKLAPLYWALRHAGYKVHVCCTMQHDNLLQEVMDLFGIESDSKLNIMRLDQDLFYLTQSVLQKTKEVFKSVDPALVIVQGDTTSTMAAAMAAFYLKIPIAHVEAGLRTDDLYAPFPEEMNRRVVSDLAMVHYAPTHHAVDNLLRANIPAHTIICTGNTVVDALRMTTQAIDKGELIITPTLVAMVKHAQQNYKHRLLLTVHRRESFNGGIEQILQTIKTLLQKHPDVFCFYPYHPNPHVLSALDNVSLSSLPNVYVCEPFVYKELVYLLRATDIVATDSGGIQEEAISLGKQVLVLREKTERIEGVVAGIAHVVGSDPTKIVETFERLLITYSAQKPTLLYGDGYAAERIVEHIATMNINVARQEYTGKISKKDEYSKKDMVMKKVCVVGLGYIGLPTSIILADAGFDVMGYDVDIDRVQRINRGDPVIQEPEVFEKLQSVLSTKQFQAEISIQAADYFIIAVPTPLQGDKKADVCHVFDAARTLCLVIKKGNVVIIESTIPVGTTKQIAQLIEEKTKLKVGTDIFVAYCPERVLPGKIIQELIENSRIIGGVDHESMIAAKELYRQFVRGSLYLTDATTAEMVKLVENSCRDVEIAFAHQVAAMADQAGLDPYEVIELANKHPRVQILQPTAGVGGHCIAIDPWFLVETFGQQSQLLKTARQVNDARPHYLVKHINRAIEKWHEKHATNPIVLLMGATYKANVDDMRESPALEIIHELVKNDQATTLVCEPQVNKQALIKLVGDRVTSITEGVERADIVVFLVGHRQFKAIDQKLLAQKTVLDFCGLWHKKIQETDKQEYLFWPARSILDIFISNQEPTSEHNP